MPQRVFDVLFFSIAASIFIGGIYTDFNEQK